MLYNIVISWVKLNTTKQKKKTDNIICFLTDTKYQLWLLASKITPIIPATRYLPPLYRPFLYCTKVSLCSQWHTAGMMVCHF